MSDSKAKDTDAEITEKTKKSSPKKKPTEDVISLDLALSESHISLEPSDEGAARLALVEGTYGVFSPRKISGSEKLISYEIPIEHKVFTDIQTIVTISELTSDVTVMSKNNLGEEVVPTTTQVVAKKDISNAVRLSMMSHMEKLLDFGTNKYNEENARLVKLQDEKVEKFFKKNTDPVAVLHEPVLADAIYQKTKGVSNSKLNKIDESYAHYEQSLREPWSPSTAAKKGLALHCLLFTPDLFEESYIVNDSAASGASNEGKFRNSRLELLSIGKTILTSSEYSNAMAGKASFLRHPLAPLLLKESSMEESFYAMVENFLYRGRIDCYILNPSKSLRSALELYDVFVEENEAVVWDLKFMADNNDNEDKISGKIIDFGYHRQGAGYCSLVERTFGKKAVFVLVTVESSAPYDVSPFRLDEAFMELGSIELSRLLTKFKAHLDNPGLYKGRVAGVKTISPPHWYMQKVGNKLNQG